jgi:hypothetical protein
MSAAWMWSATAGLICIIIAWWITPKANVTLRPWQAILFIVGLWVCLTLIIYLIGYHK